jgi:hypothetical protein
MGVGNGGKVSPRQAGQRHPVTTMGPLRPVLKNADSDLSDHR